MDPYVTYRWVIGRDDQVNLPRHPCIFISNIGHSPDSTGPERNRVLGRRNIDWPLHVHHPYIGHYHLLFQIERWYSPDYDA